MPQKNPHLYVHRKHQDNDMSTREVHGNIEIIWSRMIYECYMYEGVDTWSWWNGWLLWVQ